MQAINSCSPPLLEQRLALEVPPEDDDEYYRDEECQGEAPPYMLHAVDKVHTEVAGYEGGEHEDDAPRGHHLHDVRHVVVDDVGIGVHRRVENVGVDEARLAGLTHLDVDVLDEVRVQFVDGQLELQF